MARRKTLFDDRPVEISELTYIVKQDLASLNSQISSLQSLNQSLHPNASQPKSADQEGQHNKNVVVMLQGKVADVAANFKDVLEVRTKNIQASRSRTENFVSSVSAKTATTLDNRRSESPLYQSTSTSRQRAPHSTHTNPELLSLDPSSTTSSSSALTPNGGGQYSSDSQLLLMEEAQPATSTSNSYIQQRGEAIEAIERTISELGGIFGQLAGMVSEQSEMIQRIDANTEDVVDNVQGAQRELLKYWSTVSGNRWLVAKMFGVLMVSLFRPVLVSPRSGVCSVADRHILSPTAGLFFTLGPHIRIDMFVGKRARSSPSTFSSFLGFLLSHFSLDSSPPSPPCSLHLMPRTTSYLPRPCLSTLLSPVLLSLSHRDTHAHTHTHTQRERERCIYIHYIHPFNLLFLPPPLKTDYLICCTLGRPSSLPPPLPPLVFIIKH